MYAIVDIAGQQFKVEKEQKVFVHRLNAEEGSKVNFDKVLLVDNDGKVKVGTPTVSGVEVSATVLNHLKGEKVLVFKKKRRKGYQKMNGHRQYLTYIQIEGINEKGKRVSNKENVE
jgi:large subunit ribosomal protein L21